MVGLNFEALMKLRQAWATFKSNHPKFPDFLHALESRRITEGTTVDICITYTDGKSIRTHISLRESDLALMDTLRSLQ